MVRGVYWCAGEHCRLEPYFVIQDDFCKRCNYLFPPHPRPGLGMIMCLAFLTVQIKIPPSPPAAPAVPRTAVCKGDKCGM